MSAARPRMQRRGTVVLMIVAVALFAFGTTTQTWLEVRLPREAVQTPDLAVPGSDAATPVSAFALVALAAALAVSIAGRVARWIVAGILFLAGAGILLTSIRIGLDPAAAAAPAIGEAIGISGGSGATSAATGMPWLAAGAGLLLAAASVWVAVAGRHWERALRYERTTGSAAPARAASAHATDIDSWDRLTSGEDPTR
ncbi:Trp biosynthesis-associated membrane protein [Arthrobacter sp. TMN-37]